MPRKPPEESWDSFVEGEIRRARERGEFDDLPAAGRTDRELHGPYRHGWWLREKLRRENFSRLPPTLQLRRDVEEARRRIARAGTEARVRELVREINEQIREVNRTAVRGPPSTVSPLDPDRAVRRWRRRRGAERDDGR